MILTALEFRCELDKLPFILLMQDSKPTAVRGVEFSTTSLSYTDIAISIDFVRHSRIIRL